jgi:DNA-binding SARP family transcriptional activator/tetratricopeptide (TPR) repeat protein
MWFEVLGPLRVVDEGVVRPVAGVRQRILLSALLASANHMVTVDRLVEMVWDGSPPAGAAASLRSYVMRLRRSLGPAAAARVVAQGAGYSIEVDESELDASRFEALCRDTSVAVRSGDWATASTVADQALALWHGTALVDVPCQALHQGWLARLDQLRVQTIEGRIEAELHLGRHEQVVAELRDLAARYPLRERFHAQLMLALARGGQRSEALAAYRDARRVLVGELGIEPGPELRVLQERILAGDTELLAPPDTHAASVSPKASAVPRQLPAAVQQFSGRAHEVDRLVDLARDATGSAAGGTVVISAIDGMAGVGKTALALHAAHRVSELFVDGQLFVDLQGYTEGFQPRTAGEALEMFLRGLGVAPRQIPESVEERAALYREQLVGTRTLILLDNAVSEAQVRPLLPGASGCLVLVTSRKRLKGLDDAYALPVDVLSLPDAVRLFRAVACLDGTAADESHLERIAELCGRLPLALRIAAALIRHRPAWSLEHLAAKLHGGGPGLAGFDDGERKLAAVFELSYRTLGESQRLLFRMLGHVAGPDVDAFACAALLNAEVPEAERLLQSLVDHNLLNEPAEGRYQMHDLIRLHARSLADAEPADRRAAVLERLLDYYQHTAVRADGLIAPYAGPESAACSVPVLGRHLLDSDAAWAWLRAERANLLACLDFALERERDARVVAFSAGLAGLLRTDGPPRTALDAQIAGLAAARRLGDRHVQADVLAELGRTRRMTGDMLGALRDHEAALGLYRQLGDRFGEAAALTALGPERRVTGDLPGALRDQEEGVRLFRDLDARVGLATALTQLGETRLIACDYTGVLQDCEETLQLYRDLGNRMGEASTLYTLGRVRCKTGDYPGAIRDQAAALSLYRSLEYRHGQAISLTYLGEVHLAVGDLSAAMRDLHEALKLYRELGHGIGAAAVLFLFGRARRRGGDLAGAARDLEAALQSFRETGSRGNEACALNQYAAVFEDAGDPARALAVYRDALQLCREVKQPDDEAAALEGIGGCLVRDGDTFDGAAHLHQALDIFKRLGMQPDAERVATRLAELSVM